MHYVNNLLQMACMYFTSKCVTDTKKSQYYSSVHCRTCLLLIRICSVTRPRAFFPLVNLLKTILLLVARVHNISMGEILLESDNKPVRRTKP